MADLFLLVFVIFIGLTVYLLLDYVGWLDYIISVKKTVNIFFEVEDTGSQLVTALQATAGGLPSARLLGLQAHGLADEGQRAALADALDPLPATLTPTLTPPLQDVSFIDLPGPGGTLVQVLVTGFSEEGVTP